MVFGSLFTGIGGMDIGLELAGMTCAWQIETDDFKTSILERRFPEIERFRDVKECGKHNLKPVDVLAGGFPCQPFSWAGRQKAAEDARNLWPEFARVISELRPAWVIAENVPRIRDIYLDEILSDLEDLEYTATTLGIPALAVGAPQLRERYFILAYTEKHVLGTRLRPTKEAEKRRRRFADSCSTLGRRWPPEPGICRVAYGIPSRVDRLTAIGDAIVPQVAELIGVLIMTTKESNTVSMDGDNALGNKGDDTG